jgi:predicted TIM-barrel fold metal-dependent hydrolase
MVSKREVIKIFSEIKHLKESNGLRIYDTHVHPYDVMGAVHPKNTHPGCRDIDYLKPGILEYFQYGKTEKVLSRLFFKLFPEKVDQMIKTTYQTVDENRLFHEMAASMVDASVLLPVAPWVGTDEVAQQFTDSRFILLGTIDIHSIAVDQIRPTIERYRNEYHIAGIKLHPNLQNFYPQPSHNPPAIAEKLKELYQTACDERLYLLFHGGISNFTNIMDPAYPRFVRSKIKGKIERFCDADGRSELFERYHTPTVIAHIGHYGIAYPNYRRLKTIAKRFTQVYFDTAGVNPQLIENGLRIVGPERMLFGSDALYNRVAYNIIFLYKVIARLYARGARAEVLAQTLGRNYESLRAHRK